MVICSRNCTNNICCKYSEKVDACGQNVPGSSKKRQETEGDPEGGFTVRQRKSIWDEEQPVSLC